MNRADAELRDRTDKVLVPLLLEPLSSTTYLGDSTVVSRLLVQYASNILKRSWKDDNDLSKAADQGARIVAKILLGQDKQYSGPAWNSPGQIDRHVSHWCGVESDDPEERVAGGLIALLAELYQLGSAMSKQKLVDEQWQPAAQGVMEKYLGIFMGLPAGGVYPVGPPAAPKEYKVPQNRLPKGEHNAR